MPRIGILGGTFDPVHYGHLLAAEQVREAHHLDRVLLIPAHQSPHKQAGAAASARHRLTMLELATAGHPALEPCDIEIRRGGVSYTVDTLIALHEQLGQTTRLFLIIGSDALRDLPTWHEAGRVAELAQLVPVTRPGHPLTDAARLTQTLRPDQVTLEHVVEIPALGIAATDIRARVAAGRSIRFLTPRAVEQYISAHGLYRSGEATDDTTGA